MQVRQSALRESSSRNSFNGSSEYGQVLKDWVTIPFCSSHLHVLSEIEEVGVGGEREKEVVGSRSERWPARERLVESQRGW